MSGVRATLVLEEGATLTEDAARKALEDQGLEYGSLEQRTIERPAAAYVAVTPKFT
mgnify:CR=1 FL=1